MFDILVIGGGLGGALTAALSARVGARVALVDRHSTFPPTFRAEQLVGPQVAALERLGVLADLVAGYTPIGHALGARSGRIIGGVDEVHYGLHYHTMVARMRAQLPPSVDCIIDRITDLRLSPGRQRATLGGGRVIEARLAVLATGQEGMLAQQIGIGRRVMRSRHSLTIGLDIAPSGHAAFKMPLLTFYPNDIRHKVDYLAIFPIGNTTRVNLFGYAAAQDPWVQAFRNQPREALLAAFPHLEEILGTFTVPGGVQMRVNDLWAATNHVRDGLVLIGDAYRTSCPATGLGVSRLLLDAELLCHTYGPEWLGGEAIPANRIAAFYDDPRKRAFDQSAAEVTEHQRAIATEVGLRWRLHRRQVVLRQSLGGWLGGPRRLTVGYTFARFPERSRGQRQFRSRSVAA